MFYRSLFVLVFCLSIASGASAQLSQDARFELLRAIVAEQAAAKIAMPFGNDGVELSDTGQINQGKLAKAIKDDGQSIEVGKVVNVTAVSFGDSSIEIELDGGGKNKRSFWDRIQGGIGVGGKSVPVQTNPDLENAKGSKVTLKFSQKIPASLTPDELKQFLAPVLDFDKSNFLRTGIDALPPEYKEAVLAKEARIGMDKSTVILALGRPDRRNYETEQQPPQEIWLYYGNGYRATFVTFEGDIVVAIKQY